MRFRTKSWLGPGQCNVLGQRNGVPKEFTNSVYMQRYLESCGVVVKKITQADAHGTVAFYGYELNEEKRP